MCYPRRPRRGCPGRGSATNVEAVAPPGAASQAPFHLSRKSPRFIRMPCAVSTYIYIGKVVGKVYIQVYLKVDSLFHFNAQ